MTCVAERSGKFQGATSFCAGMRVAADTSTSTAATFPMISDSLITFSFDRTCMFGCTSLIVGRLAISGKGYTCAGRQGSPRMLQYARFDCQTVITSGATLFMSCSANSTTQQFPLLGTRQQNFTRDGIRLTLT